MEFDFYYGLQAQTFSFYRIPKLLFTDSRFSSLSAEAKTLYGILLDRMDLSMKNGWLDKQNRVYLFFTLQEIQESLGCGKNKAIQLMKELEKMGLIERKRQGMGKPSFVYVKNILSCPEAGLQRLKNQTSGGLEFFPVRKRDSRGLKIKLLEVWKKNFKRLENQTLIILIIVILTRIRPINPIRQIVKVKERIEKRMIMRLMRSETGKITVDIFEKSFVLMS